MVKIEVPETIEPIVQENEIKIEKGDPSSNQKIKLTEEDLEQMNGMTPEQRVYVEDILGEIDRISQIFKKMKELINENNQRLTIMTSNAQTYLTKPIKRNEIEDLSKNPIANSSEKDESSEKINFTEEDLEVMKGMTPDQRKYVQSLLGALPKIKELVEDNGKRLENPIWSLKIGPQ